MINILRVPYFEYHRIFLYIVCVSCEYFFLYAKPFSL